MDFFEAQQRARRITWKLVTLYLLAVLLIVVSVYFVLLVLLGAGESSAGHSGSGLWNGALFVQVFFVLALIIVGGSLYRLAQLRRGGQAVAEMLGGRKVEPSTRNARERQLLNVVEEMALASGLAVPAVYILDNEPAINAFAAGFGTADAAIGVTRGTLEQLSRDELQGVIAHEFSHIFNGDMRLNIRLIAVLNGILLLHLMGLVLMRSAMYARVGGSRQRNGGAQAALAMVVLGLALVVIGYTGMVFARIIQAAISRQREYLADAAAVQYTRNPAGIAGALRKIAGKRGSTLTDAHAMELSHLFFASGFTTVFDRLFATHPPVEQRIRAIDPAFDGPYAEQRASIRKKIQRDRIPPVDSGSPAAATTATSDKAAGKTPITLPGFPGGGGAVSDMLTPAMVLGAIGSLGSEPVLQARRLIAQIPDPLTLAAHEPLGAQGLAAALLLSSRESDDPSLPLWFEQTAGSRLAAETRRLLALLTDGRREWFLPLLELSIPALRTMSMNQYRDFRTLLQRLIHEDNRVSLFEFAKIGRAHV